MQQLRQGLGSCRSLVVGEFIQHGSPSKMLASISCANIIQHFPCTHIFLRFPQNQQKMKESVFAHTTEGERKCCDPCVLGLQVILKCHGIRYYVAAQVPSVTQINTIFFPSAYASYIDRNVTRASVFHVDYNKSTEVPAAFQLQN